MKILRQKEFAGASGIKNVLRNQEIYGSKHLGMSKSERLKEALDYFHDLHGGVVGRSTASDKSYYRAKTLSPKRNAAARDWKNHAHSHDKSKELELLEHLAKQNNLKK